jgi:hypothetical protein
MYDRKELIKQIHKFHDAYVNGEIPRERIPIQFLVYTENKPPETFEELQRDMAFLNMPCLTSTAH